MQELTDQMTKVIFRDFSIYSLFQMVREIQKTEAGKKLTAAGEEALKQVISE